jgi:hypothetical protein
MGSSYQTCHVPKNPRKENRPTISTIQRIDNLICHRLNMQKGEEKMGLVCFASEKGCLGEAQDS